MTPLGSITKLPRTLRSLRRMREILAVIAKYGFEDMVLRLGIEGFVNQGRRLMRLRWGSSGDWTRYSFEQRIRMVLEELGPTFVKFGQVMATRPDVLPMELVQELRRLHDHVPPFSPNEARAIIAAELGGPAETIFAEFEEQPLAAASIGQVHRATLKYGEKVIVKVQRPGLRRLITTDTDILRTLAELLEENVPEVRRYDPRGLVEQFSRAIAKEIDFTQEAFNVLKFAGNFEGDDTVYVPKVYPDLTTERVLTMEFIQGVKADDIEALDRLGHDRALLATRGTHAVLTMIFEHGFFHADPHPGNIFILPGDITCFIDFGMMGSVDEERIDELLTFLVGLLTGDMETVVELFRRMDLIDDTVDVRSLKTETKALIDRYANIPIKDVDIGSFLTEVFETIQRHDVAIPADLMLMGKAIATMQGIAQDLHPEFDPFDEMRGFLIAAYARRMADPRILSRGAYRTLASYGYFLRRLPRDAEAIVAKLRRGQLTVKVDDPESRLVTARQARATNNVAMAMAASALGLCSTAMIVVSQGPSLFGMPLTTALGTIGMVVATLVGAAVVIAAARSNLD